MRMNRRGFLGGALAAASLGLSGCASRYGASTSYLTPVLKPQHQGTVFHWVDIALQQIRDQRNPPPRAAYNLGMATAAGFLAANSIEQTYEDPFGIGPGPSHADPEAAYGAAFAIAAGEAFQTPFVLERAAFKDMRPDGSSRTAGLEWGTKVGHAIARHRSGDGSEPSKVNYYLDRYHRRTDALRWAPTGPFYGANPGPAFKTYARPLFPGHGAIEPWTMQSGSQFRAPQFYDPNSPEFAEEFDLVRRLGGANSRTRTKEQEEIALFWEDGPWGLTPPGHMLLIAVQALQHKQMSFLEQARAFALLGMTQCDASISAWDSKYSYDVVRPETAIRHRAKKLGMWHNGVQGDPNWKSFIPTPEFPAYTSGHSTFGAAGMRMMQLLYGSDSVSLSEEAPDQVIWPQIAGKRRHWTSFSQISEENGMSRIYGGVHWQADHTEGMKAGERIADHAFQTMFRRKV